jgi:sporulation protein YunB
MGKKKPVGLIVTLCLTLAIIIVVICVVTEVNLRPIILNTAESRVRAIALDAVNSAIARNLSDVSYDELITVARDGQGHVTLLQANTVNMNRISTQTALTAQQYIADIEQQSIRISLGSATGNPLLAGRGPEMLVKVVPVGSVASEFITEFQTAGINQTRHKVYIRIKALMRIVIPTGAKQVEVISQVPVAETVIVGQVPQSYVNVESTEDMLNLLPEMDITGE